MTGFDVKRWAVGAVVMLYYVCPALITLSAIPGVKKKCIEKTERARVIIASGLPHSLPSLVHLLLACWLLVHLFVSLPSRGGKGLDALPNFPFLAVLKFSTFRSHFEKIWIHWTDRLALCCHVSLLCWVFVPTVLQKLASGSRYDESHKYHNYNVFLDSWRQTYDSLCKRMWVNVYGQSGLVIKRWAADARKERFWLLFFLLRGQNFVECDFHLQKIFFFAETDLFFTLSLQEKCSLQTAFLTIWMPSRKTKWQQLSWTWLTVTAIAVHGVPHLTVAKALNLSQKALLSPHKIFEHITRVDFAKSNWSSWKSFFSRRLIPRVQTRY